MISAVVLARNEAINIERCVRALHWCDEIVVVDDASTDETVEIASRVGATVVQHRFESFAGQRNWAMRHAGLRNQWVLHLDADEVATDAFAKAVEEAVESAGPQCVAFALCRKTFFNDRWLKYSDGFPVWIMRLTKRGSAWFEDCGHGEVAVPDVDGTVEKIHDPLIHFAFSKGISNWIDRHNRYSSREAILERKQTERLELRKLFGLDRAARRRALRAVSRRSPARPIARFFYQYLFKLGLLDGRAGLTFCLLMAVYEWFIVIKKRELDAQGEPSCKQP